MYAKLVVGATNKNAFQCMRDICRLLTSSAPSLSDLSGSGFSNTLSIVVDSTPAGWSYVGSNMASDQPTIANPGIDQQSFTGSPIPMLAVSAPMSGYSGRLKYAIFSYASLPTATADTTSVCLFGAESVSSTGVITNGGTRNIAASAFNNFVTTTGVTLHLIATPRHITLIREATGLMAIWETTTTPAHDFYNRPAYCQFTHSTSSSTSVNTSSTAATYSATSITSNIFAVTDVATSTFFGTLTTVASPRNRFSLAQSVSGSRTNSTNSVGAIKYQISPVFFQIDQLGYPVQFISGVVPIYWCKASLGSTGDSVLIGADEYTFFNCGTTTFGVLMKTN